MNIHVIVLEMRKLLRNMDGWFEKAKAHAAAKNFDANLLLQMRLAPDMFPLVRQVQSACDSAKFAAARTAGKEPPAHADTEQTIDDLRARIATVVAYLETFKASDFDGAEKRTISNPRWEGKTMTAPDYFVEHAVPNFFFHFSMVYAVLRHNGVDVGKRDYLGQLSLR
jgi:uncharacterized protein